MVTKLNGAQGLRWADRVGVPQARLLGGCGDRRNSGPARTADGAAEAGREGGYTLAK